MLRNSVVAIALSVACLAPAARAAPPNDRFAAAEEIKEKIRAMRISRIVAALNLDERTAARLVPILNRAYDEIAQVTGDSGQARREIRKLLYVVPPDETRLNQLVDRLLANKQRVDTIENGMISQARRILPPAQSAKLAVVLPEINHDIQQQIRRALNRQGRGPGNGGRGAAEGPPYGQAIDPYDDSEAGGEPVAPPPRSPRNP